MANLRDFFQQPSVIPAKVGHEVKLFSTIQQVNFRNGNSFTGMAEGMVHFKPM
jgi:hypothetical protein